MMMMMSMQETYMFLQSLVLWLLILRWFGHMAFQPHFAVLWRTIVSAVMIISHLLIIVVLVLVMVRAWPRYHVN